ncbi:TenA family protein [Brachybacterium kimchii]|uniref:TenA family protein n=1 Tax=Brachybacterium kimchii TaxID=2942909 RepID=A0ABY4N6Y4_9MICO|nr:TenA family protein [Brachybacterium kimchii]UQN29165.1 TenA family protein [Brachybacterium kimchii]
MSAPSLFDRLKASAAEDWDAYVHHPFVTRLGEGTLPLAAFQDYLVQDYLFLFQFARANALAAYKADTLEGIRSAADSLTAIVTETALHVRLTASWGIDREVLETADEKPGTVAYTRFVLDTGMAGDALDLQVALAPCAIGYAEIGTALAPRLAEGAEHPYGEWIAEYAGQEFQASAAVAAARLDELAGGDLPAHRRARLERIFRTATRMEAAFWQQALD